MNKLSNEELLNLKENCKKLQLGPAMGYLNYSADYIIPELVDEILELREYQKLCIDVFKGRLS